jgi:hypothetical protein
MPNWCVNELRVRGHKKDLEVFADAVKDTELTDSGMIPNTKEASCESCLDFNKVLPYPEEYRLLDQAAHDYDESHGGVYSPGRPRDGFNQGGYEWCTANWGTKWNAHCNRFRQGKRVLVYDFDTAWSPPVPVVVEMSRKFPLLEFDIKFWECGAAYKGRVKMCNGVVLLDEHSTYRGSKGG